MVLTTITAGALVQGASALGTGDNVGDTIKLKILRGAVVGGQDVAPGDEVEVPSIVGGALIHSGHACAVVEPKAAAADEKADEKTDKKVGKGK